MQTVDRHLLTIIAESVLEHRLVDDVKRLGARGYSIGHVTGEGATGWTIQHWEGQSIRLDTVVTEAVADAIFEHLSAHYFEHFAVVAWITPVRVARPERY